MNNFIISGGKKLIGEVDVSGSKNATLPILAASILSGRISKLYNVPDISDVNVTIEILKELGCKVKREKDKLIIDSKNINKSKISESLMRKLRSSVIFAGALIGRLGAAEFTYPGGCDIGNRPIDLHLKSFKKIGVKIEENAGYIICKCDKIINEEIVLDFPSVGATENIILASIFVDGKVVIKNAAMEPEISDLINFLNKMGANIIGAGTNIIKIVGVTKLKNVSYRIMPDRIEAGTFMLATAITNGKVKINNVVPEHLNSVISKMEEAGAMLEINKNSINIEMKNRLNCIEITTMPYPGFPTDLQQIFSSVLTIAKGTSVVTENIFENRFKFVQELKRMGAKIDQKGNTLIIKGVKKLHPSNLVCYDLRGGMALVLAALSCKGKSKINNIEYIERGYSNFIEKMKKLGADIKLEVGD